MIRTAVEPGARVVDDPAVAVDKCDVLGTIAHFLLRHPSADIGLGDPKPVSAQRARNNVVAPAYDAFPRGRVIGEGAARRRREVIQRLDEERGYLSGGLPGNNG